MKRWGKEGYKPNSIAVSLKARIQLLKLFPDGSSRVYSLDQDMEQIYCTQLGNEEGSRLAGLMG